MKDQVLKFLADLPQSGSDQFNKALELYRKTKGHDVGKVRFYNTLGFSADRLESLLYDLKKANGVTDVEAANAARAKKVVKEEPVKTIGDDVDPELVEELKLKLLSLNVEELSPEQLIVAANAIKVAFKLPEDFPEDKELIIAFQKDVKAIDEAAKELEVQDPEVVLIPVKDLDAPVKEEKTDEATSATSEATQDSPTESSENIEKEAVQATSETSEATQDVVLDPFLQKLADFNLEEEKYNSIKSFAAAVSNFTGENPKDQKSDTLKAFIEDAKKKLL